MHCCAGRTNWNAVYSALFEQWFSIWLCNWDRRRVRGCDLWVVWGAGCGGHSKRAARANHRLENLRRRISLLAGMDHSARDPRYAQWLPSDDGCERISLLFGNVFPDPVQPYNDSVFYRYVCRARINRGLSW